MLEDAATKHMPLDWLRQNSPVFRDTNSGCFFLTRYADVRHLLTERHLKNSDLAEKGSFLDKAGRPVNPKRPHERDASMGYLDDPDHERIRRPIAQAFAKRFSICRPTVERIVAAHLDALEKEPVFDLVSAYSIPVPLKANALMIGVDEPDLDKFRDWTLDGFKMFQTERTDTETAAMNDAHEGFASYFERLIAARRASPREDLVSDLLAAQASGVPMTDQEIRSNCVSLIAASIMTTTDLISSTIWLLLHHPQELARLKDDPKLIGSAVEEALRIAPPVESEWRIMSRDLEIAGCPVHQGQVVAVSLLAANRDPSVFADPHRFDIAREPKPHVSFGGGEHICIGAPLGRLEAQLAVGAFFARFPDAALAAPEALPKRRPTPYFPGLAELAIAVRR